MEAIFWLLALGLLYFMKPSNNGLSLCVFKWMGFSGCPGCGMGHALHELMHFNFSASLKAHPLGIFAFLVLIHRIIKLIGFQNLKFIKHES